MQEGGKIVLADKIKIICAVFHQEQIIENCIHQIPKQGKSMNFLFKRRVWKDPFTAQLLRVMKLTIILLTAALLQVSARGVSQTVTYTGKNVSLQTVFNVIKKQTGYTVFCKSDLLIDAGKVSVELRKANIAEAMATVLEGKALAFTVIGKTIVVKEDNGSLNSPANKDDNPQEIPGVDINGVVLNEKGSPVEGVSILVKGTRRGTTTNSEGQFSLSGIDEGAILLISGVNIESTEIKVEGKTYLDIRVKTKIGENKEVVVQLNTGYQTISKERATGSYSSIPKELLDSRVETNLLDRMEGLAPGLFINKGSVNIRGISTLYGNQAPLYVVDGFPYDGSLGYLNPDDIVSITILKDAAAASIYGTRAANGVISITTRLGTANKLSLKYNNSFFLTPIPDFGYLNLLNSKETVDLQEELFNMRHNDYTIYTKRSAQPKAIEALYQFENGEISQSELDGKLNHLRSQNNTGQIKDYLLQSVLKQQHSVSLSGGSDMNRFILSGNYIGSRGYSRGSSNESINISIRDRVNVFKWLTGEVGAASNFGSSKSSAVDGLGYVRSIMPYEMLKDENGNLLYWNYRKSDYEIQRLISLGLHDESFNPLNEMKEYDGSGRSNYIRWHGGLNVKLIKGFSVDLKYQEERGSNYGKSYYTKNSYMVKNMVDDAATLENGEIVRNIPDGGQIFESRGDWRSYTMRAQLNYENKIGTNHHLTAILGAEKRSVSSTSTNVHKMGYDDDNLKFVSVNYLDIANITPSESINNSFSYKEDQYNYFGASEDRYVSFYANAGYAFKEKYNLTGSVRIDESNLWGSDPKYRYKPLWSVGANWLIHRESFLKDVEWINRLTLRATYGLNGNVAKIVGPYLQAVTSYNPDALAMATDIIYPPNKSLRWERTAVTNIGIDFGILQNRITGSIDFYNRKTTDLLGEREIDPTNAFQTALINYGSLLNRGFEIGLNTVNIQSGKFRWESNLNYSHNDNKMTEISTQYNTVYGYTTGEGIEKIGYPMNSLFNFKYAGLDPTNGTILVYDKEGKVVKNYDDQGAYVANMKDINGLVYSGTLRPKYTVGFTNTFSYGKATLSIFIIANGGNVFRDAVPSLLNRNNFTQNIDKRSLNFWKKPGDEKLPGVIPAPDLDMNGDSYFASLWYAADVNTLKADYIKIRDISLTYDFASLLFNSRDVSSARLLLQVQNPYKWLRNKRGLDPEAYAASSIYAQRTMPVTPTYILGLNFTF